jgi:glycosyltransferase involved in cell wall biosynthesis
MNILLVSYIFYPEPIAMSGIVCDMAEELAKEHSVTVLTSYPCRPLGYVFPKKLNKDNWNFKRVIVDSYIHPKTNFKERARESISFGRAVKKYITENKDNIDVIYGCIPPLFGQKLIVKCCKKLEIPFVLHIEDIYPEPFLYRLPGLLGKFMYRLFLPMDKYVLQNSDKVITIGPKLKEYLVKTRNLAAKNVKYVYNWQNEKKFAYSTINQSYGELFTFMYVGSLSVAANLLYIAECFIKAKPTNTRFVFAGSGNLKEKLQQIATGNPDVKIEFLEAKSDKIPDIQARANILVLPLQKSVSLRAFPSKFPAYLFSKKPVLACVEHESDVAECINQAQCGWIVEPDNSETLINLFKTLPHKSKEELMKRGKSGFEYSQQHFTRKVNLEKIVNIILEAANEKRL